MRSNPRLTSAVADFSPPRTRHNNGHRIIAEVDRLCRQHNTGMYKESCQARCANELDHPFYGHTRPDAQDDAGYSDLARLDPNRNRFNLLRRSQLDEGDRRLRPSRLLSLPTPAKHLLHAAPCALATAETFEPGALTSATIISFAARNHVRRVRAGPTSKT